MPRTDPNERVRTFVAIHPSRAQREAIGEITARLAARLAAELGAHAHAEASTGAVAASRVVRWVPLHQAHVTLAFLGDVARDRCDEIGERLAAVAGAIEPFGLSLGGVGTFPAAGRARVIWLGLATGRGATDLLARGVRRALRPLGFALPPEPFRAHLTVGRVRPGARAAERDALERALAGAPDAASSGVATVRELTLVASRPGPDGTVHTVLARLPLGSPGELA